MLYKRPYYSVAFEEAEEEVVETAAQEPLEETELIETVEDSAKEEEQIEQATGDLETVVEEADALEEQAVATDEVLAATADEEPATGEEPVADEASAITEEQVEIAEESFKWTLAKLHNVNGFQKVYSVAKEAKAEGKTRRERLKICNESVKDFIMKMIVAIRNIIRNIIKKIQQWITRAKFKFANYAKQIDSKIENLKSVNEIKEDSDITAISDKLRAAGTGELNFALLTSSPLLVVINPKSIEKAFGKIKEFLGTIKDFKAITKSSIKENVNEDGKVKTDIYIDGGNEKISKDMARLLDFVNNNQTKISGATIAQIQNLSDFKNYGFKVPENDSKDSKFENFIPFVTGNTGCVSSLLKADIKKISLELDSDALKNKKVDATKLLKLCVSPDVVTNVKAAANNIGKTAKFLNDVQSIGVNIISAAEAAAKMMEASGGIKTGLKALKGAVINLSMFIFQAHSNEITSYVKILTILEKKGK